jgi:hypothetical protein
MPQLRADQAAVYVTVNDPATGANILDNLVWASMDGGDMQATDTKTRPGAMGDELNLGGPRTRTDCTVTRQYTNDVLHPIVRNLERVCGNAAGGVAWKPLDGDGNPDGANHGISGKLKEVMVSKRDANATEAIFLTLVFGCNATPIVVS